MKHETLCLGLGIASFGMACYLMGVHAKDQKKTDTKDQTLRPIKIRLKTKGRRVYDYMENVLEFQRRFPNTQISVLDD